MPPAYILNSTFYTMLLTTRSTAQCACFLLAYKTEVCEITGHLYNSTNQKWPQPRTNMHPSPLASFPFHWFAFSTKGNFIRIWTTPGCPISAVSQHHMSTCSASLATPGCCICGSLKRCSNCHHMSKERVTFLNAPFLKGKPSLVGFYIKYWMEKELFKVFWMVKVFSFWCSLSWRGNPLL